MKRDRRTTAFIFRRRPCEELPNAFKVSFRLSWESTVSDLMEAFFTFLISCGFSEDKIEDHILAWADEIESRLARERGERGTTNEEMDSGERAK